jgi:NADH-quinone oxidoreductase subunit L
MKIVFQIQLLCSLIIGLPLLGFVINGLGFRRIPKGLAGAIGSLTVLGSLGVTMFLLYLFQSMGGLRLPVNLFNWIQAGDLEIGFSFFIDQLSLLMLLIITGVGLLIHVYSIGYMKHDEGCGKFFAFLNLFVFFMLILVMGGNYVVMFIGWEGVGLCSYLLIGFWNTNLNYGNAARKAFIMNRIGDLGFLLGIFLIFNTFGSVNFETIFNEAVDMKVGDPAIIAITLLLFVGAMGKSAQIPLYTWLPDAMAGPTPVSALIHAATMVTAGIYMVVRSNVLYVLAPVTLEVIAIIGLVTALFAATIGIYQNDIKKVLAYSTVSQLGYMFLALGVGSFTSGMFHVMTHAFFKALLFLGAGSVIHAMSDEQDIRNMGGLRKKLPITFLTFLIGTVAIAGIPPFAGFFSKDEILAHVFEHNKIMWALAVLGSMMTSFYMFRLLFVTFFGEFRGTHEQEHHLHESPLTMTLPLVLLAILSVFGGFLGLPPVFSEKHTLANFLSPVLDYARRVAPERFAAHEMSHSLELTLMGVSVAAALVALGLAYVQFVSRKRVPKPDSEMAGAENFVYHKYYIDEIYDLAFVKPINKLSAVFYNAFENLIDFLVETSGKVVSLFSNLFRLTQVGATGYYMFAMVFGIGIILLLNFIF